LQAVLERHTALFKLLKVLGVPGTPDLPAEEYPALSAYLEKI